MTRILNSSETKKELNDIYKSLWMNHNYFFDSYQNKKLEISNKHLKLVAQSYILKLIVLSYFKLQRNEKLKLE